MNKGIYAAVGAYILWGLLPIYWKFLGHVPVFQVLSHRIVWSFIFLGLAIVILGQWHSFRKAIQSPRVLFIYILTALLVGLNWFIYVWAVHQGFIIETSLGYFINPLISVLMGIIFLKERLRLSQWLPIIVAASGVIYLAIAFGSLPWISLSLAITWATYALLKKLAPLGSLYGLTLETAVLLLPAIIYLIWCENQNRGVFLHYNAASDLLLAATGIATSTPLLLFALAVQRIPLSLTGILQYIAPTIQFLIGLFIYHEPFNNQRLIGFILIWIALVIFALEGFIFMKQKAKSIVKTAS
jgi:chloramphenicol-sensitive protein RarD